MSLQDWKSANLSQMPQTFISESQADIYSAEDVALVIEKKKKRERELRWMIVRGNISTEIFLALYTSFFQNVCSLVR